MSVGLSVKDQAGTVFFSDPQAKRIGLIVYERTHTVTEAGIDIPNIHARDNTHMVICTPPIQTVSTYRADGRVSIRTLYGSHTTKITIVGLK